jgi:hypothetical protein
METLPIYVLGSTDAVSFGRGKMFARCSGNTVHELLELLETPIKDNQQPSLEGDFFEGSETREYNLTEIMNPIGFKQSRSEEHPYN